MRPSSPEIDKLLREYNDLTARLHRGTSPNPVSDQARLRELVTKIDKLRQQAVPPTRGAE